MQLPWRLLLPSPQISLCSGTQSVPEQRNLEGDPHGREHPQLGPAPCFLSHLNLILNFLIYFNNVPSSSQEGEDTRQPQVP